MSDAQGCKVVITQERGGYHLYLPCPACLHEKGRKELGDPKYAINLSTYLRLTKATQQNYTSFFPGMRQQDADDLDMFSSVCMRTVGQKGCHRFKISELLAMPTISERHPDIHTRAEVAGGTSSDKEQYWVPDENTGVLVPPPPGQVTPVTQLPEDHPAIVYIRGRGLDPAKLYEQFRCSWCHTEWPHGKNNVWHKKFSGGWRDTAQNRLIFYSMHEGTAKTWQARVMEWVDETGLYKYHLHPYTGEWNLTHTRPTPAHSWMLVSPFDALDSDNHPTWKPAKYKTAMHGYRELMGWDAAVKAAQDPDKPFKWCVLVEGPLDAARIGPGGIAIIGKSISALNASMIASNFQVAITAFDNDESGRTATETVRKMLLSPSIRTSTLSVVEPMAIPSGKDLGEMRQNDADDLLRRTLIRRKRSLLLPAKYSGAVTVVTRIRAASRALALIAEVSVPRRRAKISSPLALATSPG